MRPFVRLTPLSDTPLHSGELQPSWCTLFPATRVELTAQADARREELPGALVRSRVAARCAQSRSLYIQPLAVCRMPVKLLAGLIGSVRVQFFTDLHAEVHWVLS